MSTPAKPRVYVPSKVVPMGDGTWRVVPQKPIVRLNMKQAMEATGLSSYNLQCLVECGILAAEHPTPRNWCFDADEILAFLEATRDPAYWSRVRKAAYLTPMHARKLAAKRAQREQA